MKCEFSNGHIVSTYLVTSVVRAFTKIASSKLTLRHVNLIKRWMDFAMSMLTMCWMRTLKCRQPHRLLYALVCICMGFASALFLVIIVLQNCLPMLQNSMFTKKCNAMPVSCLFVE